MNVDHFPAVALQHRRPEDEHPPGKDEQIWLKRRDLVREPLLKLDASGSTSPIQERHEDRRNARTFCSLQRTGVWPVTDNCRNRGTQVARAHGVDERLQIAAGA